MPNGHVILWIYIALLVVGGVMGFVKAKSKASLIASTVFAVILTILNLTSAFKWSWIVLLFLLIFFGYRFIKTKKVMPNIMMAVLSLIAIILLFSAA